MNKYYFQVLTAFLGMNLLFLSSVRITAGEIPDNHDEPAEWGDLLNLYMMNSYMPAEEYIWNWNEAVYLRAVSDRYENDMDKEKMFRYLKTAMDINMEIANGENPNAVVSGFGMALLARVTGKEEYREKAFKIYEEYNKIPRAANGGISHRDNAIELWDDTVYMVSVFLIEMYKLTGDEKYLKELIAQYRAHADKLADEKTGLWYHGWDAGNEGYEDSCCMPGWSDNPERRNDEFWGRGNGWITMTLADLLKIMPETMPERAEMQADYQKMINTLIPLQDKESGHWYQLPIYPGETGNYIESSCTAMFAYSIAQGIKIGILNRETYFPVVEKAYAGFGKYSLKPIGDYLTMANVCIGTCIGDKAYYYGREIVDTRAYAIGVAIMFYDLFHSFTKAD